MRANAVVSSLLGLVLLLFSPFVDERRAEVVAQWGPRIPSIPSVPSIPRVNIPVPQIPRLPKLYEEFTGISQPEYRDFNNEETREEGETLDETIEKLLDEFGSNARYGVSRHFIFIYDTTDSFAQWAALICERVESTYEKFVYRLGLRPTEELEPMVVLLFTNKEDYERYATKVFPDFASRQNKPIGFYSSGSNRTALYDMTRKENVTEDESEKRKTLEEVSVEILTRPNGLETLSVLVHETTHQVSANLGLFSRYGRQPTWAQEGLATLFEAPVGEAKEGGWNVTVDFGPNLSRIREFQAFAKSKQENPIRRVISAETISGDVPGSYEISWALFSYLYKKYPNRLAAYLYYNASQQPRTQYPSQTRIMEFEYFFTKDWDRLLNELCAFVDELEKNPYSFTQTPREQAKKSKEQRENEEAEAEAEPANPDDVVEVPKSADDIDRKINGRNDARKEADEPNEESETRTKTTRLETENDGGSEPKVTRRENVDANKTEPKTERAKTNALGKSVRIEGITLEGKELNWSKYKGKRVVVFFFATWNRRSVEIARRLVEKRDEYLAKGVEIVGYSIDDDLETLVTFVEKNKVNFPVVSQFLSCGESNTKYEDMAERYAAYSLPVTIFVGVDGRAEDRNLFDDALDRKVNETSR